MVAQQCTLFTSEIKKKKVNPSFPGAKMQFLCNCLTLSERKISTSTSPLEPKIIFNQLCLTAVPGGVSSILTMK